MNPHQLTFRLSRLDAEECPRGVPADVWALFVCEADKVRLSGRTHYSARTICEHLRHNAFIENPGREFVINNNWIPDMARAFMRMRGCYRFFAIRDGDTKRAA
jgi:hypothetical protein